MNFPNSASYAAALVFYLPAVCTRGKSPEYFKIFEKTIFNEHPVAGRLSLLGVLILYVGLIHNLIPKVRLLTQVQNTKLSKKTHTQKKKSMSFHYKNVNLRDMHRIKVLIETASIKSLSLALNLIPTDQFSLSKSWKNKVSKWYSWQQMWRCWGRGGGAGRFHVPKKHLLTDCILLKHVSGIEESVGEW